MTYGINLMGGCAAMLWSGHTIHAMLAGYFFGSAIETDFPRMRTLLCGQLKLVCVVLIACVETALLVMAHAHYTVDMVIAVIVGLFAFTNEDLKRWCVRVNPYLRQLIPAREFELYVMDPMDLREKVAAAELQAAAAEEYYHTELRTALTTIEKESRKSTPAADVSKPGFVSL